MNLSELVARAAAGAPERTAVIDPSGAEATWAEMEQRVASMAGFLRAQGIGEQDAVGVLLPNGAAFATAYWGTLRAGAVAVPLNPAYTERELRHILTDADVRLVLSHPALAAGAAAAAPGAPVTPVSDATPPTGPAQAEPFGGGEDCAVICYTSGTTGSPKGARLSHANFLANLEAFSALPALRLREDDVLLGLLPFFHIFGLNVILNAAAHHRAAVLAVDRFNPVRSLEKMAEEGVTVAYGAPPVFAAWNAVAADRPCPLPALRAAVSGADALGEETFAAFADRFGLEIMEGYGLTECAPVLTSNAAAVAPRPGSVGLPLDNVRLEVTDPAGHPLGPGQVGEVCAKGPNVFSGYHRQPEATAEVFRDGWFRTGDLGSLSADGHLTIHGRLGDMVIVSGFNVYPKEVEDVLRAHPGVADAAVLGAPDPRTGERVRAFVSPRAGAELGEDELAAHCREQLARYKLPREIHVIDAIPRGPTGKLQRQILEDFGTRASGDG